MRPKTLRPARPKGGGRVAVVARIAALAGVVAIGLIPSSASALGFPPANAAIAARVQRQYPGASQIFTNCPGNNQTAAGINCEFRFIWRGKVRDGEAIAEPDSDQWRSANWSTPGLLVQPGQMQRWKACSHRGLTGRDNGVSRRLAVFGLACGWAARIARAVHYWMAFYSRLRPPRSFRYQREGREELGFVIHSFGCSSRVQVRRSPPGSEQPLYGHETVRCHTRFGDRVVYVFDHGS
jgi:hypothetical protein